MLTIELPAIMENLRVFQKKAAHAAKSAGFSSQKILNLELVLEELLTNIFHHAYGDGKSGPVWVTLNIPPDEIRIRIEDQGAPFNLLETETPDTTEAVEDRPIGGLGIFLVRQLTDSLTYSREDDKNVVELVMKDTPKKD